MKELSVEKQIYLCKYHDIDDALNVTLGISRSEAQEILNKLKANGMYDQYRKLSEDEYEKIIHTEERKDKFEKILDKYNFDKESTRYSIIKDVLIEAQADKKDFKLKEIIEKVATKRKTTVSAIENETNRALTKTYEDNRKLFKIYEYKKKPSLKEFIQKELKTTKEVKEKVCAVKENVQEVKARTIENKQDENINKQFTLNEIDLDGTVKVPLKTLLELVRNIGYLDRVKEEESK